MIAPITARCPMAALYQPVRTGTAVSPEMVRVVHVVPQPLCGRLEPEAQQG